MILDWSHGILASSYSASLCHRLCIRVSRLVEQIGWPNNGSGQPAPHALNQLSAVVAVVKAFSIAVLKAVTAVIKATAINVSNMAYSAAARPSSSFTNRRMAFNMVVTFLLCHVIGWPNNGSGQPTPHALNQLSAVVAAAKAF